MAGSAMRASAHPNRTGWSRARLRRCCRCLRWRRALSRCPRHGPTISHCTRSVLVGATIPPSGQQLCRTRARYSSAALTTSPASGTAYRSDSRRRWGNILRFGVPAALPAVATSHLWQSPVARALFAGVAAHGWPVAKGGSQAITDAFVHALQRSGGHVTTGSAIRSLDDLPTGANDIVMLDTTPQAALNIIDASRRPPQVPTHVRAALSRYRYGPGVAVVNFAIDGNIPWTYQPARRAGTVHLGGSVRDIHAAEREINRGRLPERPFVLVTQQYVADPSRSSESLHPIDAYAHVPAGYTGNRSEQYEASALCASIERQIEHYAPGFRERIVAKKIRTPADVERDNANFVGGNITTGANTLGGLLGRPRLSTNPYTIAAHGDGPRVYLCSAATPPGAGAHGLCGLYAAQAALSR